MKLKRLVWLLSIGLSSTALAQDYDDPVDPHDTAGKSLLDGQIASFTRTINADPANASNYLNRGVAELQRSAYEPQPMEDCSINPGFEHDRSAAIADLSKFIELQPNNSEAYDQRGLAKQDFAVDALDDFHKSIQIDPKNALAYLHLGRALIEADHINQETLDDFSTAIRLDPGCAPAYFYRALVNQRNSHFDGTIEDLSECIRLDPSKGSPYSQRAWSEWKKGDYDAAEADYSRLIEIYPKVASYWVERADMKSCTGNLDGAIADTTQALKISPAPLKSDFQSFRGGLKQKKGDYQSALTDYRTALNSSPEFGNEAWIRLHIWVCESRLGGKSTANRQLALYVSKLGSPWGDWQRSLFNYLLGKMDEAALRKSAANPAQVTEAERYIEIRKSVAGP